MIAVVIVCSILSILCFIVALLLSRSGSSGGLASIGGQDLEIFKKTKDRGWIKGLQIFLFMMTIVLVVIAITVYFTTSGSKPPESENPPANDSGESGLPSAANAIRQLFIIYG